MNAPTIHGVPLEVGRMYRIRQVIPGVWIRPRESCMRYLGTGAGADSLLFSARPRLGTQEVNGRQVTEIEQMPDNALVYVAWRPDHSRQPDKWRYQR